MRVAVVSARRTPIGKFLGSFSKLTAIELGMAAARAALEDAGVQGDQVDEVILGNARQAGLGPNPARQVGVGLGLPVGVPAMTINQACASGLQTMFLARDRIRLGDAAIVLAGGMENMTRVPHMLPGLRLGYRLGHDRVLDGMYRDGFDCPLAKQVMGETAETLATRYEISR
jgi:acetyl-CoA C-acetyltransferase